MPVNPWDCNFKICYRVTNGVTSELGSVFLTISVILLSKYVIENVLSTFADSVHCKCIQVILLLGNTERITMKSSLSRSSRYTLWQPPSQ